MYKMMVSCRSQRYLGYSLFMLFLFADSAIGLLLLSGADLGLLWLHLLAVLVSVLSIQLMSKRNSQQDQSWAEGEGFQRRKRLFSRVPVPGFNRYGLVALSLGLLTFPGLGLLACAIARSIAWLMPQGSEAGQITDTLPSLQAPHPPLDMQVQPLIDLLRSSDLEQRRAAVTALSHLATPEAILCLRQLLSDEQAEIRSDASIILTRLEYELAGDLHAALERWRSDTTDHRATLDLVDQYYRYATSNVLDRASQHAYLAKACDLLQQMKADDIDKMNAELWLKLARIRQRLGETAAAAQDALRSIQLSPGADAYLLAIELAFRLRYWNTLDSLITEAASVLPDAQALSAFWHA